MNRKGPGIYSVADVMDRCYINDKHCWEWKSACSTGKGGSKVPVAWSPIHGRLVTVQRLVYWFKTQKFPQKVWRTCCNSHCVNPDHLMGGTEAQWGKWAAKKGKFERGMAARVSNRRAARKKSKITMELAGMIRASDKTGRQLAKELGVTDQVISRIRTMKTFVPLGGLFTG